ncbi:hypothetical protein HGP28_02665 [Vibrio sp. SM6]|uniref:Uncharacterized protein n=1 Tax=Vibrio agarilyticus TaxID=2726741 RepID=A0A7X8TNJ5_9VIBR|nr:hypothetical protein [Vibrio agarilyticus]NLS11791.1 hypothetical protein [Vibrio agarilyticus]
MKVFFEVHLRLVITIWVILIAVLGLLYLMNYIKFDSLSSNVVSSKLDVISESLSTSMKRVERLGIPYQSAENLEAQFDRAKSRQAHVITISYIDIAGNTIIQVSDISNPVIPTEVVRRAFSTQEPKWLLNSDNRLFRGLKIVSDFGQVTGSLVIEYDKSALHGVYAQVRLHLLEVTILLFLLAALVVFLVVRMGFSDVANVLRLIQGHALRSGASASTFSVKRASGTISQNFAEQLVQSEQMKARVVAELDSLHQLASSDSNVKPANRGGNPREAQ